MGEPVVSDRKCYRLGPGLYRMDQIVQMAGQDTGYDATGNYWVVGCVKVVAGEVRFLRDGKRVGPRAQTLVMAMPKHSVVSAVLNDASTVSSAIFSKTATPQFLPAEPIVFPVNEPVSFSSLGDVERVLKAASGGISIQRASRPNPKTQRLVKHFAEHFNENTSLPDLAAKFGLAASVLSRTFRRDWGKPPIHFRNYLRILDSFRHLAEEHAVTDVAFEVGFNDLSRFMKQFKGTVGHTPGSIQKRSKNAK
jgi:AraC-like DNA-binding protein